jgi:hypothetical protein
MGCYLRKVVRLKDPTVYLAERMKGRLTIVGSLFVLLQLISVASVAEPISLEQALVRLETYRFGEDTEPLDVIRDAAVRSFGDPSVRGKLADDLARILEADTGYGAKQFTCRQLALIGSPL